MKHWQYQNPVEIHFGAGVLETLPKVLAGRNATLVTFPEAESFPGAVVKFGGDRVQIGL